MNANLRTGAEPLAVRTHVRGELGPPAYCHAHFSVDDFYRHDCASGAIRNVYGQRLLLASGAFLAALTESLLTILGSEAVTSLNRIGRQWGESDFDLFKARMEEEYGVPLGDLDLSLVLESWWWPKRAQGWGNWQCDLSRRKEGFVSIDVENSAVVAALGRTGYCECHLYAGLFAGAMTRLTSRSLDGVEISCAARGDERCRFIVAAPARIEMVRGLRDGGASTAEILRRLTATGSH
jgi:predicted hydrocarbon binding protein